MVVMPASISRARWLARMPATSSRSSCSRTWIVHSGQRKQARIVSSSQRDRLTAGQVVVEQPLQGRAPGTVHRQQLVDPVAGDCAVAEHQLDLVGATGTPARASVSA